MPVSIQYPDQAAIPLDQRFGSRPHALAFGLVPDAQRLDDGVVSGNSVTSASGPFLEKHVGRTIVIPGAGASGALLVTTIAGYSSPTQVSISTAASVSVSSAVIVWGTDNADAFDAAIASVESGGNALYVDGGLYLTTRTITLRGNFRLYGPCTRIDDISNFDAQNGDGRYSAICSTANPIIEVYPYPGVSIENVHFAGLGTNATIETWDRADYRYQIGMWAGNITKPLATIATGDDYAYAGSGGIYVYGCTISHCSGYGMYLYKCWGQSTFEDQHIFYCGAIPEGDAEYASGEYNAGLCLASECAELVFNRVSIGGPSIGCGVKLHAKKADIDALDRFNLPHTHTKFNTCHIESSPVPGGGTPGKWTVRDFGSIETTWVNCMFGGAYTEGIEIGEEPLYSWDNNSSQWLGCRSFKHPPDSFQFKIKASKVSVRDWHAEGTVRPAEFIYWYPSPIITGKNIVLVPSGDNSQLFSDPNSIVRNRPMCITNRPTLDFNLAPDFHDNVAWTFTGSASVRNATEAYLFGDGVATLELTGLTPNAVYTFGMRHENTFGADLFNSIIRIFATGGSNILLTKMGFEPTAAGVQNFVMLHFLAPSSGNVSIEYTNTDVNTVTFGAAFVGRGPMSTALVHDYLLMVDQNAVPGGAPIIGQSLRHLTKDATYNDRVSRAMNNYQVSLLSSPGETAGFERVGVGFNLSREAGKWVAATNNTENGAAAILTDPATGAVDVFTADSLHDGTTQRFTDAELAQLHRLRVTGNNLSLYGNSAEEANISIQKRGALGASNLLWRLSHRPDGTGLILYATDGTDFWNLLRTQYSSLSNSNILLNTGKIDKDGYYYPNGEFLPAAVSALGGSPNGALGLGKGSICLDSANGKVWRKTTAAPSTSGWVDMAFELPAGAVGTFLQRVATGTGYEFNKVDLGAASNVQMTGAPPNRPVRVKADGSLEAHEIVLTDPNDVELGGIPDGWFLISSGGVVSAYSPAGASAQILGAPGAIGTISGLAGFDLTTLNTVFGNIATQIADLYATKSNVGHDHAGVYSEIGHGHSGTTSSGGSPAHTHGWST